MMSAGLATPALPGWLADVPAPPPGQGPEWGKAAPIGALVLILLGIAVWLLMRNMSKHLRKVRDMADAELNAELEAAANDAGRDAPRVAANDAAGNGVTPGQGGETPGLGEADDSDADIDLTKHEPHTGG